MGSFVKRGTEFFGHLLSTNPINQINQINQRDRINKIYSKYALAAELS